MFKVVLFILLTGCSASAVAFSAENAKLAIVTPEHTYSVDAIPTGNSPQEIAELDAAKLNFDSLTPAEKIIFEQSRSLYLNKIAHILSSRKVMLGSLVRSFTNRRRLSAPPMKSELV